MGEWTSPGGCYPCGCRCDRGSSSIRYASPGPACNTFGALTSVLPGTLPAGVDDHGALLYHCLDVEQPVAAQLAIDEGLLIRALGGTHDDT